jgi:hypothetical protein
MLDADEALMKSATLKPRSLVKMADTRWNVLFLVLRRFRSLNPALRKLREKIRLVDIPADKVGSSLSFFFFVTLSSFFVTLSS